MKQVIKPTFKMEQKPDVVSKQDQYDSKEIQEWCEKFNTTQEDYYKTREAIWSMFAGIGKRTIM